MSSCGQQITIKRPNHQHVANDITDFVPSVNSIINQTILNSASADWNSVFVTVSSLSADWETPDIDLSAYLALTGGIMTGGLSAPSISADTLYVGASTIYFLNNLGQVINSFRSSDIDHFNEVYTTVLSSSGDWSYQGTDIKNLTSNWQDAYTSVLQNSADWNDTVSLPNTGLWDETYTTFSNQSANNISVYSYVSSISSSLLNVTDADMRYINVSGDTMTGGLSGPSINIDYIDVDAATPGWKEGRVFYDNVDHTLAYYNDSNQMTVNIGQEHIVRVYNGESVQINNGEVVYINGSHGNTPQVFLADAHYTSNTSDKILGIATTDIPATGNRIGYITVNGIVHDIGTGTTAYTEGDNIFLSLTSGQFTAVPPTKPNHIIDLGMVIGTSGGGSNHRVDVFVRLRHIEHLSDLCDVISTTLSSNDVLVYNPLSGGHWTGKSANNWDSVYSTVQSNSALNWSYQGTDIKALTGNWESTYTTFSTNSATSGGITIGQVMALQSINIY